MNHHDRFFRRCQPEELKRLPWDEPHKARWVDWIIGAIGLGGTIIAIGLSLWEKFK